MTKNQTLTIVAVLCLGGAGTLFVRQMKSGAPTPPDAKVMETKAAPCAACAGSGKGPLGTCATCQGTGKLVPPTGATKAEIGAPGGPPGSGGPAPVAPAPKK